MAIFKVANCECLPGRVNPNQNGLNVLDPHGETREAGGRFFPQP